MPELAEVYQGVSAPKRKRVEEQPVVSEIPKVTVSSISNTPLDQMLF